MVVEDTPDMRKVQNAFTLQTKSSKSFCVYAATPEIKYEWLTDLRRLIELNKKNQDSYGVQYTAPYIATSIAAGSATTAFASAEIPNLLSTYTRPARAESVGNLAFSDDDGDVDGDEEEDDQD